MLPARLKAWLSGRVRYAAAEKWRGAMCAVLEVSGVGSILAARSQSGASVLVYHSVGGGGSVFRDNVISESAFDAQMRFISRHMHPVPLSTVLDAVAKGAALDRKWVAVTFDDGYRDFVTTAVPILQRYGIPASFYVPTGVLHGEVMYFDEIESLISGFNGRQLVFAVGELRLRLPLGDSAARSDAALRISHAVRGMPPGPRAEAMAWLRKTCADAGATPVPTGGVVDRYVTREDLRNLPDDMEVGSHSVNHFCLSRLDDATLHCELAESAGELTVVCGRKVETLAYPFGGPWAFDGRVAQAAARAGYGAALTTVRGKVHGGTDLMAVPRIGGGESMSRFRLNLQGLQI